MRYDTLQRELCRISTPRPTCFRAVSPAIDSSLHNPLHQDASNEGIARPFHAVHGIPQPQDSKILRYNTIQASFFPRGFPACHYVSSRIPEKISACMSSPVWASITYCDGGYSMSSPGSSHHVVRSVKAPVLGRNYQNMEGSYIPSKSEAWPQYLDLCHRIIFPDATDLAISLKFHAVW